MKIEFTHIVPATINTQRLRNYLQNNFSNLYSKKSIKKAIENNEFHVNHKIAKTSTFIKADDLIEKIEAQPTTRKDFHLDLDIIFEDEYLAIINKPSGIEVSGNKWNTVENALTTNLTKSNIKNAYLVPKPVHRLDFATSGMLIIAKEQNTRRFLGEMLEHKKIKKTYTALSMGKSSGKGQIRSEMNKKTSVTSFHHLHNFPSLRSSFITISKLSPITGRTHQLRKHLTCMSHPILGDQKYGKAGEIFYGKGLFLTASELKFIHPITEKLIDLKIKLPQKFYSQINKEIKRWLKFNSPKISLDIINDNDYQILLDELTIGKISVQKSVKNGRIEQNNFAKEHILKITLLELKKSYRYLKLENLFLNLLSKQIDLDNFNEILLYNFDLQTTIFDIIENKEHTTEILKLTIKEFQSLTNEEF